MKTRYAALRSALRYGSVIQAQLLPGAGRIPDALLATAPPEQRALLIRQAESFGKINAHGAADQKTREAWERVINPKRGGSDGSAQRKVLQGPAPGAAAEGAPAAGVR